MSKYGVHQIYDAIAMADEGSAIALAKRVDIETAEYLAERYSERFGVVCYVLILNQQTGLRRIFKKFISGNEEKKAVKVK